MEEWRGTAGGQYYYVREGNRLRHISSYATGKAGVRKSSRGLAVEYEVPASSLEGRLIYGFGFSNSGYFYPMVCRAGVLFANRRLEALSCERVADLRELKGLEFEIRDATLKQRIEELKTVYRRMVDEVKDYARRLNFEILFMRARRTEEIFKDAEEGLIPCLVLPNDRARVRCLKTPMRWIYQLWTTMLVCKALGIVEIKKREYWKKPLWLVEQGSLTPMFVALGYGGTYSFWFMPQPTKWVHLVGAFERRRAPIKPDILVSKGEFKDARELDRVDLVIECKSEDFRVRREEDETKIVSYTAGYGPRGIVLASMKTIPPHVVRKLENVGIKVVSGLAPDNPQTIANFMSLVRSLML